MLTSRFQMLPVVPSPVDPMLIMKLRWTRVHDGVTFVASSGAPKGDWKGTRSLVFGFRVGYKRTYKSENSRSGQLCSLGAHSPSIDGSVVGGLSHPPEDEIALNEIGTAVALENWQLANVSREITKLHVRR